MAMSGTQCRRPPLVLLEQPGEALPPRLGELERLALAIGDLELLELVAEQDVLQLGLALDVPMLLATGQPVQRGLGDVDIAGFEQRLHLPEEKRQREGANVGSVDVSVGMSEAGLGCHAAP